LRKKGLEIIQVTGQIALVRRPNLTDKTVLLANAFLIWDSKKIQKVQNSENCKHIQPCCDEQRSLHLTQLFLPLHRAIAARVVFLPNHWGHTWTDIEDILDSAANAANARLSIYSIYLSIYPSTHPSIHPSMLSIYLSVSLSI
jgi:hypothetical protein